MLNAIRTCLANSVAPKTADEPRRQPQDMRAPKIGFTEDDCIKVRVPVTYPADANDHAAETFAAPIAAALRGALPNLLGPGVVNDYNPTVTERTVILKYDGRTYYDSLDPYYENWVKTHRSRYVITQSTVWITLEPD